MHASNFVSHTHPGHDIELGPGQEKATQGSEAQTLEDERWAAILF